MSEWVVKNSKSCRCQKPEDHSLHTPCKQGYVSPWKLNKQGLRAIKIAGAQPQPLLPRPRRRPLEAFTTGAKIIRLISRRVVFVSDGGGAVVFRRRLRRH